MTDERTVRRFALVIGATVVGPYHKKGKRRSVWIAYLLNRDACRGLRLLLPFLINKKKQARLALKMEPTIMIRGHYLPKHLKVRRREIQQQIKEAKYV